MEEVNNNTLQTDFHILAYTTYPGIQLMLFMWFLLMYLLIILTNMTIISLVSLVSHLHTPMYFFLCNLSIQDILYVSAILPKLLNITITGDTSISVQGCITQVFMFLFCLGSVYFLLPSMAYDRYVAICIPLRYALIMNWKVCGVLSSVSWLIAFFNSLFYSLEVSKLSYCKSCEINHVFCDMKTLLALSCSDTTHIINGIYVAGVFYALIPCVLIIISYIYIIFTVLKISIKGGRMKTFSSCSSHLTIVIMFYGTSIIIYMKPESQNSQEKDKLTSMLYIAIVPLLNPLVYSLRNQDILQALRKVAGMKNVSVLEPKLAKKKNLRISTPRTFLGN